MKRLLIILLILPFLRSLSTFSQCPFTVNPDLDLLPSNDDIDAEITTIFNRFSTAYLGSTVPSLTTANSIYDGLDIGGVSELAITSWGGQNWDFLRTYVQYLRNAPSGTATYSIVETKVNTIIEWASDQFCSGTLKNDYPGFLVRHFLRPASLAIPNMTQTVKDKYGYVMYEQTYSFHPLFVANYDEDYQANNLSIITDVIYNRGTSFLAYCLMSQNTPAERYRYMRSFKRYMERFFSYTSGTSDGIKPDGSGFHHWTAYNNYLFAYKSAAEILEYLDGTIFQVNPESYKVFRDAVCAQYMQANDHNVQALSTCGRHPQLRFRRFGSYNLRNLAIVGGNILGLTTADPILAGMYNRIHGIHPALNYTKVTPFEEGFFQFNHASAGAYRKNNWLAFNKGFSRNMFGSEIFQSENRYGRYQSYGALEIIYPGNIETGNGYDVNSWNWNYNPGATTIRLPFAKLEAEAERIDEEQEYSFVGALAYSKKNTGVLNESHGTYGIFVMDFQEREGLAWRGIIAPTGHNKSFVFKKSTFFLDDLIICLGSGISNNDMDNNTVTTLYQRIDNKSDVYLNGISQTSINTSGTGNRVVSNYNTGFYIVSNNTVKGERVVNQQTPDHNQGDPTILTGDKTYYLGYLDHGTNPDNAEYEYIIKPSTTVAAMESLHANISGGKKPYKVHQKDANAHILEYPSKNIYGYAFFAGVKDLNYKYSNVKSVDTSCLVLTKYHPATKSMTLAITNPDVGVTRSRSYAPVKSATRTVTLHGEWTFNGAAYTGVKLVSSTLTETVIEFTLKNGLTKEMELIRVLTAGIQNHEAGNMFIFPNPATNILNVSGSELVKEYAIFDVSGKQIRKKQVLNNNQIDVSTVKTGFYFIQLIGGNGTQCTKRVMIK